MIGDESPITNHRSLHAVAAALLPCVLALVSACATTNLPPLPRALPQPDSARAAVVLSAWDEALRRADSMAPSRILYDAKFSKGSVIWPGNLAVYAGRGSLTAKASGPLGGQVGSYENGRFTGPSGDVAFLDPEPLRGVLAGVWRGGAPEIAGADDTQGLLRFRANGALVAEALLDVPGARLRILRVHTSRGDISAEFSGSFDPWPEGVSLIDQKSGRTLRLRRVAVETIQEEF